MTQDEKRFSDLLVEGSSYKPAKRLGGAVENILFSRDISVERQDGDSEFAIILVMDDYGVVV